MLESPEKQIPHRSALRAYRLRMTGGGGRFRGRAQDYRLGECASRVSAQDDTWEGALRTGGLRITGWGSCGEVLIRGVTPVETQTVKLRPWPARSLRGLAVAADAIGVI